MSAPSSNDSESPLQRGRACYQRHEWKDAFEALSLADRTAPLAADDLSLLAWSAGLTAHDDEMLAIQERVYQARLAAGENLVAARAAFWLGFRLMALGEPARASGWLGRSQRLAEEHAADCVELGYLLLPAAQRHLGAGELERALECAARAQEIGERFQEPDLVAFAHNLAGRVLLAQGQIERGLSHLDESMVAATAGELTPVVTGIVYCASIASCHKVFALDRVREWTAALSAWVDARPQLGMFTGHCLVHRAEMFELSGAWPEAVDEARRAVARCVRNIEREAAGRAHYQQAEIHRLRGDFDSAEAAYHEASRSGVEPLPGMALLRLAQGDGAAAASASLRIVNATTGQIPRLRFLPAHVEIMLAGGNLEAARAACAELQEAASSLGSDILAAIAAHACASMELAQGNPQGALVPARHAFAIWQRMGAPYLAARMRILLARACHALGDAEGAQLETRCAREVFEKLGALPDLARLDEIARPADAPGGNLSGRELQVLRLVATGKTNKVIARELSLSEKTVDRHVSNIFDKVGVASRAAATAFAYEHDLI